MTRERFKEHFTSDAGPFLILPADGRPARRADGLPLTQYDLAILAGRDPIREQYELLPQEEHTSAMMTEPEFAARVAELVRRGFSAGDAERIAAAAGDVHELDEQGRWIVRDSAGAEIARIEPLE